MTKLPSHALALVTGASGGIGLALARRLAADQFDLVIVSRQLDRLQGVASELSAKYGVRVTPLAADLATPNAAEQVCDALAAIDQPLDVLINNAGVGAYGLFHEQPLETVLPLLQLNVVSLTELTRRLLPGMVARRRGYVMNVASTAAFQPGPLMAVYYASKAYVLHFSEALYEELRGTGVVVSAFCPGPTATGFEANAQMQESKLFASRRVMTAERAAEIGYRGLWKGKPVVIPGFSNRLFAWATRLPPRSWLPKIARHMQEPR